jgi:hypothetical protein
LPDGDNDNGQNKPTGDEAEGKAAPSTISQIAAAPSGSKQKKKHVPLSSKRKLATPSPNPVMTHIELPPYFESRSPLNLVAIEIIFGRLFEAFQHTSQAISTGTSAGVDTQLAKKM